MTIGRSAREQPHIEIVDLAAAGMSRDARIRLGTRRLHLVAQHVLRQRQHHRAGAAGGGDGKGAGDEFRDAGGIVDLAHPFGDIR